MRRLLTTLFTLTITTLMSAAVLQPGTEYYLWLNIYEKLLGNNEGGTAPSLSSYGTQSEGDSYIFIAEESGTSGYVLLKQKSSGRYLAASGSNSYSMVFESNRSTEDRFLWSINEGTYVYLVSKKNGKYVGIDGATKGNNYVGIYYDKVRGSHSQWSAIPAVGENWNDARAAYESEVYTNAQGVKEIDYTLVKDKTISRSDAIDIHITSNDTPISGTSSINLGSDRTWLIFDNIVPSKVKSDYLKYVTINGVKADADSNCRVAIYLNGAAVIPTPSTIFTASGSKSFTLPVGSHTDLKENSNTLTSFTLRRGHMATLSSGRNGSGHSRVYVADHADLNITLPQALAKRVTSVFIKKWQYVSKKGWGNTSGSSGGPGLRATWYWSWSAGYWSSSDMEYVPCQQHKWWPSTSEVNEHASSATLSLNEPEHSEQHTSDKCSCGGTIDAWTAYGFNSGFQASGARIGSPQPTDLSYLTKYFKYVDENNNQSRCDFAVTHAYWDLGGRNADNYAEWFCNTQCKSIWNNTKRPVWLTEMEVSASWNSNKIDSYEKNRQYLQSLLQKIDECPWIERYAIYGTDMWQTYMYYEANPSKGLTPAGQVYRDHRATFAYNSSYTKEPVWWAPDVKKPSISVVYNSHTGKATFTVSNPNTDMTNQLVIEMSSDGTSWQTVTTITDREKLEDSKMVISNISVTGAGMGTKFRVNLTTLNGKSSQSDAFELGTLINGGISANSKTDIPGWTCVRVAQNGYTKGESGDTYFEVWDPSPNYMSFDYYQNISGLKDGVYRLSAKVFNSSNGVSGASVNDAVGLYAQTNEAMWFAPVVKDSDVAGADELSLSDIVVTDGTLRVGVRNMKSMTARWAGADDFKLSYLGTAEEILGKSKEEAIVSAKINFIQKMTPLGDNKYDVSFLIHNPDGVNNSSGWTFEKVDIKNGEAYDGVNSDPKNTYFDYWASSQFTSTMSQDVYNLPAGTYILSAILRSNSSISMNLSVSNGSDTRQKSFSGNGATGGLGNKGWQNVALDAITISNGQTMSINLKCTGTSWWSADHFQLTYVSDVTIPDPEPDPQPNGLAFDTDAVTATLGSEFETPVLSNPNNLSVTWKSSNESVATVSDEGSVTLIAAGTTIITATFAGNKDFEAGDVSYTLTVEDPEPEPQPNGLSFDVEEAIVTLDSEFEVPVLNNPNNLYVTWSSSDESVATVNEEGAITLVATGSTTITATFAGSDEFEAGSVSYILTVQAPDRINAVGTDRRNTRIYSLTGIQLSRVPQRPGIYIINGKKIIR